MSDHARACVVSPAIAAAALAVSLRFLLILAACCGLTWYAQHEPAARERTQGLCGVGISLAGAEFGADRGLSNASPGVHGLDYTYNSGRTTRAVAQSGIDFIRLPFRWERIQPVLSGPLDPTELHRLAGAVRLAEQHGLAVLLDLHNYGRYHVASEGAVVEAVIDRRYSDQVLVTREHFADVWRQLATHFQNSSAVAGYGLMNEPHGMGGSDWKAISQAAVDAIRVVDQQTLIVVAGDEWSSADRFTAINGPTPWIIDSAGKTAYEAHAYFDQGASGKYELSYDEELRLDPSLANRGVGRVKDFLAWVERNKVTGLIGEVGVPTKDPRWLPILSDAVREATSRGIPVCLWAAGEWWGDYPLSLQEELLGARNAGTLSRVLQSVVEEQD